MRRIIVGALACGALAACADGPNGPIVVDPVSEVDSVAAMANPHMVVSALVRFDGTGDYAYVRYRAAGSTADSVTPLANRKAGTLSRDTIAVLGLLPQTQYEFRVIVRHSDSDSVVSAPVTFTTSALPAGLPSYTAGGSDPLPGYVVFGAGRYGVVIDRTGRVVWYKLFPVGGPGLNFMAQPSGVYTGRLPTADATDDDPMVEVGAAGNELRQLRCAAGRQLRFHDLIVAADQSYWIMCNDSRPMDLTAIGGVANADVMATTVQHIAETGTLLFEWNAFDHFALTDLPAVDRNGPNVNFTHGNSIELDTDGHLLISFRSLSEVTKVNVPTGAVMWRMGGIRNQFAFGGGTESGWSRQHNVRAVGPNRFILLDNSGGVDTRFERYQVNTTAMTATLEQAYTSTPGVNTVVGGSVQQETADRYLVSFGQTGRVEEFDLSGNKLWEINGNPGYVFRAQRITSLYHPVPRTTR